MRASERAGITFLRSILGWRDQGTLPSVCRSALNMVLWVSNGLAKHDEHTAEIQNIVGRFLAGATSGPCLWDRHFFYLLMPCVSYLFSTKTIEISESGQRYSVTESDILMPEAKAAAESNCMSKYKTAALGGLGVAAALFAFMMLLGRGAANRRASKT